MIVHINPRKSEVQDLNDSTQVSFVPMEDVNENQLTFNAPKSKSLGEVYQGYTYFREGDVILAKVTPCFENGKAGIAKGLKNGIGFGSSEFYVLRSNDTVLPEWIYINVVTQSFRTNGVANFTGTSGLRRVPKSFIESYRIPVPSLDEQRHHIDKVMAEIVVIDGNKKLIEVYTQKIQDRISKVWGEGNDSNPSIDKMLAEVESGVNVYPKKWYEFFNFLKSKLPPDTEISLPFILGGSGENDYNKNQRFKEHLRVAEENGVIDEIKQYISSFSEDDWERSEGNLDPNTPSSNDMIVEDVRKT